MSLLVRLRQRLARSPWMYWAGVAVLALFAGLVVARAAAGVDEARGRWGATRAVVVAVTDLAPGDPLAGAVSRREVPAPLVPAAAVDDLGRLGPGAVARQHIAAGEIVVTGDVAALGGPRALIPAGWLAVPVAEAVPSGARVGDPVQVAAAGVLLAAEAVVVGYPVGSAAAGVVLVAVPAAVAAPVAHAGAGGEAALLLTP